MLLLLFTSLVSAGRPSYPTTAEMEMMRIGAEQFGQASCEAATFNVRICVDYQTYWKTGLDTAGLPMRLEPPTTEKLLIVSVGQTFRGGSWMSTALGDTTSVSGQRSAVDSHVAFARFVKARFGVSSDFIVNTYSSPFQNDLMSWYPAGTRFKFGTITPGMYADVAYQKLLDEAMNSTSLAEYCAVVFIRADIFLKPGFFHYFRFFDKITFSFILGKTINKDESLRPIVGDILLHVPRSFFNIFNNGFRLFHDSYRYYSVRSMGFMVNTYHWSNSADDVNPLYYIVNRAIVNVSRKDGVIYDDFDGIWEDNWNHSKADLLTQSHPTTLTPSADEFSVLSTSSKSADKEWQTAEIVGIAVGAVIAVSLIVGFCLRRGSRK